MQRVKYLGVGTEEQIDWSGCDDPRGVLVEGEEYEVEDEQVHAFYTLYVLQGVVGEFNSVFFEDA